MKIKDVRYKWSKLFAAKNFGGKDCLLEPIEQQELLDDLDNAEKAIDEEMDRLIEWMGSNYQFGFDCLWHPGSHTTAQLLHLYKNK